MCSADGLLQRRLVSKSYPAARQNDKVHSGLDRRPINFCQVQPGKYQVNSIRYVKRNFSSFVDPFLLRQIDVMNTAQVRNICRYIQ